MIPSGSSNFQVPSNDFLLKLNGDFLLVAGKSLEFVVVKKRFGMELAAMSFEMCLTVGR